jgi:hypothetical protein
VATIAELCFMAQWAWVLRELAWRVGAVKVEQASRLVVPLIAFAECNSWYAILTTNYLGNVIEESTWTLTGFLLTGSALVLWPKLAPAMRRLAAPAIALGIGYLIFMTTVDVPMYLRRWRADTAAGKVYMSVEQGLADVATRWHVTWSYAEWRPEMPWMALYFSVAVWASLAMVRFPRASLPEGGR